MTGLPAGWKLLPDGYVIPGVTRITDKIKTSEPVIPLCGHAELTSAGWSSDCLARATHRRPGKHGSGTYSCTAHLAETAAQTEEDPYR